MSDPCAWHVDDREKLGYIQWHDRAERSMRRGARQRRCPGCDRLWFVWETRTGRFPASVPREATA